MIKEQDISRNVVTNLEQLVFPALNGIRRRSAPAQQRQIDVLKENISQITSGFGRNISAEEWRLSAREIEVCNLVREGVSTLEIADILCTSKRTIDNHRNRIRKKLGLSNSKTGLHEYLRTME